MTNNEALKLSDKLNQVIDKLDDMKDFVKIANEIKKLKDVSFILYNKSEG